MPSRRKKSLQSYCSVDLLPRCVTAVWVCIRKGIELQILTILVLRTFARKFSNIGFFLKILPLKDDELVMSEMQKNGGHRLCFGENMPGSTPKSVKIGLR